jgi:hypothetical protein
LFTWKWIGRFALTAFLLAIVLPLVYRAVLRSQGQSELEKVVKALDESDPGWTLDDLCTERNAKLPPAERNSFAVARQAREAFPRDIGKEIDDLSEAGRRPANTQLRSDELAVLEKFLAEYAQAVAIARRLTDHPEGGRSFMYPEMPLDLDLKEVQEIRGIFTVLSFDAFAAAQRNRPKDAIHSVRAGLNASRAIGDEPCMISQLVRTAGAAVATRAAARTFGLTQPTESDGLATLQAEFFRDADAPRLLYGMRGERASIHRMFQLMDSGKFFNSPSAAAAGVGSAKPGLLDRAGLWALRGYLPADHLFSLDMMTKGVEAAKLPFDKQREALKDVPRPPPGDIRHIFTGLLAPAVDKVNESGLRIRGELLATAVGIACERYRLRTGAWPATLDDLPKDILAAIPNDPFTGRRIAFKRLADGIVVYSVGPDGKDDGGAIEADEAAGAKQTDYGIRLWDPGSRRAAAPPPKPKEDEPTPDGDGPEVAPPPRDRP